MLHTEHWIVMITATKTVNDHMLRHNKGQYQDIPSKWIRFQDNFEISWISGQLGPLQVDTQHTCWHSRDDRHCTYVHRLLISAALHADYSVVNAAHSAYRDNTEPHVCQIAGWVNSCYVSNTDSITVCFSVNWLYKCYCCMIMLTCCVTCCHVWKPPQLNSTFNTIHTHIQTHIHTHRQTDSQSVSK